MSHIIVGTAGHIDHGKSTLVKALTGTDPSAYELYFQGRMLMLGPGAYSVDARLFGRCLLGRRPPPFG